jgi:hypothetical protein
MKTKQVLGVSDFRSLLILAICPEYDIQLQALDELLQFTENTSMNKQLFLDSKSIDPIMNLYSRANDNELKKKCIALLSSITDNITHSELRRFDLIKTFLNASNSNVIEMRDDAAFGLGNMAKDRMTVYYIMIIEINKFEIKRLGGMDALTNCLIQNDPDVLLNSLRALEELFNDGNDS